VSKDQIALSLET